METVRLLLSCTLTRWDHFVLYNSLQRLCIGWLVGYVWSLLGPGWGVGSLNLTDLWCFIIHQPSHFLELKLTDWTPPSGLQQLLLSYSLLAFSRLERGCFSLRRRWCTGAGGVQTRVLLDRLERRLEGLRLVLD